MNLPPSPPEGLRARKRRELRRSISDAATHLFLARGFDAVSVEDVARAANVSKATVFNYFACKEDLLLDRGPDLAEHITAALKGATKTAALPALRNALIELIQAGDPLSGSIPAVKWFWPLVASTPSLLARAQQQGEKLQVDVSRLLSGAGWGKDAKVVAAMAVGAWWLAWREAAEQVLAGKSLSRVRATQRATIERAFQVLIGGLHK